MSFIKVIIYIFQIKLIALQQEKNDESNEFKRQMEIAHNDYRQMHEHLSNDKKLLAGKLNSLEEFRIMRDDLMKKFAMQEKFIEEREKEFQRTIYNLERQHVRSFAIFERFRVINKKRIRMYRMHFTINLI